MLQLPEKDYEVIIVGGDKQVKKWNNGSCTKEQ